MISNAWMKKRFIVNQGDEPRKYGHTYLKFLSMKVEKEYLLRICFTIAQGVPKHLLNLFSFVTGTC